MKRTRVIQFHGKPSEDVKTKSQPKGGATGRRPHVNERLLRYFHTLIQTVSVRALNADT